MQVARYKLQVFRKEGRDWIPIFMGMTEGRYGNDRMNPGIT